MTKEELAALGVALKPLFDDVLDKLGDVIEKLDTVLEANERDYLKVRDVADECGVTVQAIHWHLANNPNLEPDKDYFKRNGRYFLTHGATNRLKKQLAKNG